MKRIKLKRNNIDVFIDTIYPIGSIYMSVEATNPEILFGGTWERIQGRFLWATGSTPKVQGGSTTTDVTVLTIDQIPSHTHDIVQENYNHDRDWAPDVAGYYNARSPLGGAIHIPQIVTTTGETTNIMFNRNTGGSQGHTHTYMPPYFEVYMWYRIS